MKKTVINYPGDLKFRITADKEDFSLHEDDFMIVVMRRNGRTRRITKGDCFWDDLGRWYFTMEKVRPGTYWAWFIGSFEDDDYDKQRRVWTDGQVLIEIPGGCRCRHQGCHAVSYEQVWTVSIDGEDYLADCDGKYILTSDGKRICFKSDKAKQIEDMGKVRLDTLTGEQFKQLIEGKNPNNEIDTLPEMLDAAQGISDEETIHEHTGHQIEQELEEEAATNEDIDEMFAEQGD